MNWKEELDEFETNKQWAKAIDLLKNKIDESPDEAEPFVRLIYLLHNLLLEEDYAGQGFNHDDLSNLLLNYFETSFRKFKDDPEYLFFVGIIMHIAEWYFGQKDVSLALQLQKKATDLEPENILYEFSYKFSTSDKPGSKKLAQELQRRGTELTWLKSKGFPGSYALEIVNAVLQDRI